MSATVLFHLSQQRILNSPAQSRDSVESSTPKSSLSQYPTPTNLQEVSLKRKTHISSLATTSTNIDDLVEGLSKIQIPALILGVQSDILFPCWQQKELSECLKMGGNKEVTYYELDSLYGHDTFLIDLVGIGSAVKGHLEFGG